MKNTKIGTVEFLGYIGSFIWAAIILLRSCQISDNNTYILLRGILPNLGAAWLATMLAKWIVILGLKRDVTIRIHFFICIAVFILALISEVIHDLFLGSPFDRYDIIMTAAAQLIIFFAPILLQDKYFSNYLD